MSSKVQWFDFTPSSRQLDDMTRSLSGNELVSHLRSALQHLYHPAEMRRSPLFDLLGLAIPDDRVAGLRALLQTAIQALKPHEKVAADSSAQRTYDILTFRFIEQSSQKEVAGDLAISQRQLQRLETVALQSLAETLAAKSNVVLAWAEDEAVDGPAPDSAGEGQVQKELAWLKKSYQVEGLRLADLLEPMLLTLSPFLEDTPVLLEIPDSLPMIMGQTTSLQQAMLNILDFLAQAGRGPLSLSACGQDGGVRLQITAESDWSRAVIDEKLAVAHQLLSLSEAKLTVEYQPKLCLQIMFRSHEQPLVLVVDDNQDTLLLLERYLAGSDYSYLGIREPQEIFPILEKMHPKAMILDVMLPGSDGWSLLTQIKQLPASADVRVIISTILPQERLAQMLGADAFLQKPFSREQLLAVLGKW